MRVAAAISLRDALTQIGQAYEAKTGAKVEFTFGSSGQLMAQIQNGAPIDAFISAGEKQVDDLAAAGLVDPANRRVIAGNALVLIVPANVSAPQAVTSFADLLKPQVARLAIGEPTTVPAGLYALETLKSLRLDQPLVKRIVYGSNVRQVLDYVERGEVDAGLVYATDARQAGKKVRVVAVAPASTHEPIVYPAVVLKTAASRGANKMAAKFLDYLVVDEARSIFADKGFTDGKARPATRLATAPESGSK